MFKKQKEDQCGWRDSMVRREDVGEGGGGGFMKGLGSRSKELAWYKVDGKTLVCFQQGSAVMQFTFLEIPWLLCAGCRTVVLNQGRICPPGDIQQYLETFLLQCEGWW